MTQDKRQSLKRTFFRADVFASSPPNDPQPGVWLGPASVPPSLSLGLPPPFALDSDFHHHSLQLARALAAVVGSPDHAAAMVARGRARAATFTWSHAAESVWRLHLGLYAEKNA